jgi:hypothetical protein
MTKAAPLGAPFLLEHDPESVKRFSEEIMLKTTT